MNKLNIQLGCFALVSAISASHILPTIASPANRQQSLDKSAQLSMRNWGFFVNGYSLQHQEMANTINLSIRYTLKSGIESPEELNFTQIFNRIDRFLTQYPNKNHYWEIVNRSLTEKLLQSNPKLASLTVSLEVMPNDKIPYTRTSIVTGTSNGQLTQQWSFVSLDNPIQYQGRTRMNIRAEYTYRKDIQDKEYPNFIKIQKQIVDDLASYLHPEDSWEKMSYNLAKSTLKKYPSISSLRLRLEGQPTSVLTYPQISEVTLTR